MDQNHSGHGMVRLLPNLRAGAARFDGSWKPGEEKVK
jgi:hypothetical protein